MEIRALLQLDCMNLANKPLDLSGLPHGPMGKRPWAGREDGPINYRMRLRDVLDVGLPDKRQGTS